MADVSHTHPYGDHGAITRPFQRGPVVAADGGRREARDEDAEEARDETEDPHEPADEPRERADEGDDPARMRDVDHTPPYGDGEEVDRVFERGGREEPVESEE